MIYAKLHSHISPSRLAQVMAARLGGTGEKLDGMCAMCVTHMIRSEAACYVISPSHDDRSIFAYQQGARP